MAGATAAPTIVSENGVGPADPPAFVAVTWMVVVALAFGVPVTAPVIAEIVAQPGRPVADHVIGAVPVAENW